MRRLFKIAATAAAGLFLAAAPAVAHAQDSIGGGSLPAGNGGSFAGSAETVWEAYRFDRTFTPEQITECWEAAGDIILGVPPCPSAPINALHLATARVWLGSIELGFGSLR
ncbi:hypothetical protein [Rhodococcus spongiicola]|uniref:Uncharacterized protein n=1 Tax=Rhodococcus spongiicola TaxID=2487352 RepID=A0A3S3B3R8_9NOCA|nr:hypothetical protein [Rhodococcus spongiicola]RVW02427.1 hypothetical protein EF834_12675 [Rhodococcus spongiicola]